MATTIANLNVRLTASNRDFVSKMRSSTKQVRAFSVVVKSVRSNLLRYGAAIAAIAGPIAIVGFIKKQFELIDSLGKTSDKLGISVEKMQVLRFAAGLTGVEIKTLDKGLQNMVRNISDASRGTGEAVRELEMLGVNAKELARLSPDEQFLAIADAMEMVKSNTDRVNIAYTLFGGRATALLNTLALQSKGIRQVEKDLQEMGAILNRLDVKRVEDANDAFLRLKTAIGAVRQAVAAELAPDVETASNRMVNSLKQNKTLISDIKNLIKDMTILLMTAAGFVERIVNGLRVARGATPFVIGSRIARQGLGATIRQGVSDIERGTNPMFSIDPDINRRTLESSLVAADEAGNTRGLRDDLRAIKNKTGAIPQR